ncbi:hypothetical protein P7C70_g9648, partial [Phenoliferia sp. Uapishka_3]
RELGLEGSRDREGQLTEAWGTSGTERDTLRSREQARERDRQDERIRRRRSWRETERNVNEEEEEEEEDEDCPPDANRPSDSNPITFRHPSSFPLAHPILSGYAPFLPPALPFSNSMSPAATAYQATSVFFPVDSTPEDLLGLDWDEWGERLFVATEDRIWEWQVDGGARRSFGVSGVL